MTAADVVDAVDAPEEGEDRLRVGEVRLAVPLVLLVL